MWKESTSSLPVTLNCVMQSSYQLNLSNDDIKIEQ